MSRPRRFRLVLVAATATAATAALVTGAAPAATASATIPIRTGPPNIQAVGAELANAATGIKMWARQPYAARPIASITKVMTAYVVLESGHIGRYIKITQADQNYVNNNGASSAGLIPGDVLTARQLLYAMMLPSGCDAALALADAYGPGWPAFVKKMNAAAAKLHLVRTHFTNFDGLASTDVSNPRNLLLLGEAAMRLPFFRDVVKRRFHSLAAGPLHHSYFWRNTNYLLTRYPGVIGIKTGWTPAAGESLLFYATRGTKSLIGVVLDSAPTKTGQSFVDAARMLNWGFGQNIHVAKPTSPFWLSGS